ncbi:MAG: SMI1/KNR4 family protein [Sphingomonas sp.]
MDVLDAELLTRLRDRAADPARRTDDAGITASAVDLGALIGQLGTNPAFAQATQRMPSLVGQFSALMQGFGVVTPMPQGDLARPRPAAPLAAAATEADYARAEAALGRPLPTALRQLYAIADGGFGPDGGLFSLDRCAATYRELTADPAGPQNQAWPASLVPLTDRQPGHSCLDLDSGAVIDWDPEEIDGYGDAAWRRSFKPQAASLAAWIDRWLDAPDAQDALATIRKEAAERTALVTIAHFAAMTAEQRAKHGLPETGWEDELRRRHGAR